MNQTASLSAPRSQLPAPAPQVDVVVPVFNEAAVLGRSIERLDAYLAGAPFSSRIVIADNASTDATLSIARRLARSFDRVEVVHLDAKGRGRALRAAWSTSGAEVVCYMDVDLSTDLRALPPLVAPLLTGHSELAIGTRLARDAHVQRSTRREVISRTYNLLLHAALRVHFSDAQCGFKAIRADAARALLPSVEDEGWFFDTELLVAAQRHGYRIHEVPVDWVEDRDSRVDVLATALGDLRGVARLLAARPLVRFAAIGVLSTLAYALLYLTLRGPVGVPAANAIALALTAVANTAANRRITFGIRDSEHAARQHLLGALVYVLTLALTQGALAVLTELDPHPSRTLEVTVLVVASGCATVTRYVALRTLVFARALKPTTFPIDPPALRRRAS